MLHTVWDVYICYILYGMCVHMLHTVWDVYICYILYGMCVHMLHTVLYVSTFATYCMGCEYSSYVHIVTVHTVW